MEELLKKLGTLIGDEAKAKEIADKAVADGATDLASAAFLTEADWIGYGLQKVKARQLVQDFAAAAKPAPAPAVSDTASVTEPVATGPTLLPALPDDAGFLKLLQEGGIANMEKVDVVAAIRALIASSFGLFDVEDAFLASIEAQSIRMKKPFPPIYYDLETGKFRKQYAPALKAMGIPGRFVTEARKKEFLSKMRRIWILLEEFQGKVANWYDAWMKKSMNPGMIVAALGVGGHVGLPPGMMSAPDTSPVRSAAVGLIDTLNEMFAGPGVSVARALAAEAVELRKLLDRDDLMAAVGASSREEMILTLEIGVNPEIVDAEAKACQYALAVMTLSEVTNPRLQTAYISELCELGQNTPWSTLAAGRGNGKPHSSRTPSSPEAPKGRQPYLP